MQLWDATHATMGQYLGCIGALRGIERIVVVRLRLGKIQINLIFRSACTNVDCVEVRLRLGNIQINLIFHSTCTNFANCMVSIEHLSVEFSARPLFTDVSFVINPKDRIALVG